MSVTGVLPPPCDAARARLVVAVASGRRRVRTPGPSPNGRDFLTFCRFCVSIMKIDLSSQRADTRIRAPVALGEVVTLGETVTLPHRMGEGGRICITVHLLEMQGWMRKNLSPPADPYINRSVSRSAFHCTFHFLQQSSFRLFIARSLLSPVPLNPTQALK